MFIILYTNNLLIISLHGTVNAIHHNMSGDWWMGLFHLTKSYPVTSL